jgi:hypothetical protein
MPAKKPFGVAGSVMIVVSLCGIVAIGAFLISQQPAASQKKPAEGKKARKVIAKEDAGPAFKLPDPVPDAPLTDEPAPAEPAEAEIDMRPAEIPPPDPAPAPDGPAPRAAPPGEKDEYADLGRGPLREVQFKVSGPSLVHTKKFRCTPGSQIAWMFHPASNDDEIFFRRLDANETAHIALGSVEIRNGERIRAGRAEISVPGVYLLQIVTNGNCGIRITQACVLEGQEKLPDVRHADDFHMDDFLDMDVPGAGKKAAKKKRKK